MPGKRLEAQPSPFGPDRVVFFSDTALLFGSPARTVSVMVYLWLLMIAVYMFRGHREVTVIEYEAP